MATPEHLYFISYILCVYADLSCFILSYTVENRIKTFLDDFLMFLIVVSVINCTNPYILDLCILNVNDILTVWVISKMKKKNYYFSLYSPIESGIICFSGFGSIFKLSIIRRIGLIVFRAKLDCLTFHVNLAFLTCWALCIVTQD